MGKILPKFKASIVEDMAAAITANSVQYYAFASNPIENVDSPATETGDYKSAYPDVTWPILFGKKLSNTDIIPVISNIVWETNTAYARYNDTIDTTNSEYYVVASPDEPGGYYHIFKCINNANGEVSTEKPDQIQVSTFTKSDGYMWRYIYSISDANYNKFATDDYVPLYSNSTIVAGAYNYSGVEVVPIVSGGAGYDTYHSGTVRSNPNSTIIQIENDATAITNFYQNTAIYLTNNSAPTSQLLTVSSYVANVSGNWVILATPANTDNITSGITSYDIAPRVLFDTDGDEEPKAYTVVSNTANSISEIVVIDAGYGVTRASATIVTSVLASVTSVANVYCIVSPPGGHGYKPDGELPIKGMGISISFSGTESNTITTDTIYNTIGILKNPYELDTDNTKGSAFSSNTFSSLLDADVSGFTYTSGETVTGVESGATGIVVFANSTVIHLTGDKYFQDDEIITNDTGDEATISINSLGDIYTKDLMPMYYRNIVDVSRANSQVESFKLIVEL